jgi:thymidylate synthase
VTGFGSDADDRSFSVSGLTIGESWDESIRRMLAMRRDSELLVDSLVGGPSIEASLVTIRVAEPLTEPRISSAFVDPGLVDSYVEMLRARSPDVSTTKTLGDRIYAYQCGNNKPIDQFRRVVDELKRDPGSRRAIIQLWDPASDLAARGLSSPASHVFLQFTVRQEKVNLAAFSRSIDAWEGAVPNMLGFIALQERLARRLRLQVGWYSHVVVSYHLYLQHIPLATELLGV